MLDWLHFRYAAILACSALVSACVPISDNTGAASDKVTGAATVRWPASLNFFGGAYPAPGSLCRRVGESKATIDFLDDAAILIGCPDSNAANALGGRTVATIDEIILVSVPLGKAPVAAGRTDGDVRVAGTNYNATAQIKCSGYRKHPGGRCPAGVKRKAEGGLTIIDITWPAGDSRALYFDGAGRFVGANTNQADGSAAFQPKVERRGDTILVTIGPEHYEFAEIFVTGD